MEHWSFICWVHYCRTGVTGGVTSGINVCPLYRREDTVLLNVNWNLNRPIVFGCQAMVRVIYRKWHQITSNIGCYFPSCTTFSVHDHQKWWICTFTLTRGIEYRKFVFSPPPLLNWVNLPTSQTVNTPCSSPCLRACFSAAFSLSVSDGAAGKRQLSLYITVWVYSCKNDSNSIHSGSVWGFFLWFCEYERAVGRCGCRSCCYAVHNEVMLHFCLEMCALQFVAALVCIFCVGHPLGTKQAVCAPSVAEMYTSYNRRLQSSIGAAFLIVPHVQWAFLSFFLSFLSVSVPLYKHTDRVSDQKPAKLTVLLSSSSRLNLGLC